MKCGRCCTEIPPQGEYCSRAWETLCIPCWMQEMEDSGLPLTGDHDAKVPERQDHQDQAH